MSDAITIKPQPGPQTKFLRSPADLAIFGGSAGGGKSWALLLEGLRHSHNPRFGSVIFRRTTVQIKMTGGLWDESQKLYPLVAARGRAQSMEWFFPSGAKLRFSHMEHEKNRFDWQGAQIPFIGFDEITHFTDKQFWYLVGRNRSDSGVGGYIRGTCNPDPDSWVRRFIAWWIDEDSGFAIKERAGKIRWFIRAGDEFVWADSRAELKARYPSEDPKSVTFIPASVYDNKILLEKDPRYLSNLKALPWVERAQLLEGNWNVRPAAGNYFKAHYFGVVDAAPAGCVWVRFWDRAATKATAQNTDPDATSGVKLGRDPATGVFYIADDRHILDTPMVVERSILNTAQQDGTGCAIGYNQDPGSAGVYEAQQMALKLQGYNVRFWPATGDKETRAKPVSAQAEAGNIKLVAGQWNQPFLRELENFPFGHDDRVDALSGAFQMLVSGRKVIVA